MVFDKTELDLIKYTPGKTIDALLNAISANDTNLTVSDPTNPFTMLLEANVISSISALEEIHSVSRKLFPSLAKNIDDLYHHVANWNHSLKFASPSKAQVTIMINYLDLLARGTFNPVDSSYTAKIPKYTELRVGAEVLTTINDVNISVRVINGVKSSFIEEVGRTVGDSVGNIYSTVSVDVNNVDWVSFNLDIPQLSRTSYEFSLNNGIQFDQIIPITSKYSYSEVYMRVNSNWVQIEITYSPIVYDHDTPTVSIVLGDDRVRYTIPNFYIISGKISGILRIDTYTTNGARLVPLQAFTPDDWEIKYPTNINTEEGAAIRKIATIVFSRGYLSGGVDSPTLEEFRNKVIYNTVGGSHTPITTKQLNKYAIGLGFNLHLESDTITERLYTAVAVNPPALSIFNNTVELSGIIASDSIVTNEHITAIKSNTVFMEDNGKVYPATPSQIAILTNGDYATQNSILDDIGYMFTPFYYMLDLGGDYLDARAYDMDSPRCTNMVITNKNTYTKYNVNISKYGVFKYDFGYKIVLGLFGDDSFASLDPTRTHVQISMDTSVLGSSVIVVADWDASTSAWVANVNVDFVVDPTHSIAVDNNVLDAQHNSINIDGVATFIIYTDGIATDGTYDPTLDIVSNVNTPTALCKETARLTFGTHLKYMWSKLMSVGTYRQYLKSPNDIPLTYKSSVFNTDDISPTGNVSPIGGCPPTHLKLLHLAGDVMTSVNGEPIYEYKTGDTILDDSGEPIVDIINGYTKYVDIAMFEMQYRLSDNPKYIDMITQTKDAINEWVGVGLVELNNITLEQTTTLYKPHMTAGSISSSGGVVRPNVSPEVTLYMKQEYYDPDTNIANSMIVVIGDILESALQKEAFVLTDVKEEIMSTLTQALVAVKIVGITDTTSEVLSFEDTINRVSVKKKMSRSNEVEYDITLKIEII